MMLCLSFYLSPYDVFPVQPLFIQISLSASFSPLHQNFGLDYHTFQHMVGDCPPDFLQLAFNCCNVSTPSSCPIRLSQTLSSKILQSSNLPGCLRQSCRATAIYLLKLSAWWSCFLLFKVFISQKACLSFHCFIFNFLSNYCSLVQNQRGNLII